MNHDKRDDNPEDPKKSSETWTESDKHDIFLEDILTMIFTAIVSGILLAILLT